ncbi:unnamed protein product [Aphanomyces euteiches]|uniref:Uncharacterized protein n=1 Tax=Aphanomyces euteiches TaxID=100861 RepID=A0A6G0XP48_9STRA|nr:hypothetical protein Ae201684_002860 [Aphanomyces euteiches]KAH9155199.1 hypothetical protein AeRB84_002804 [Aphanomyces euteiches]
MSLPSEKEEVFYFEEIPVQDEENDTTEKTYTLSACPATYDSNLPAKRGGATLTPVTSEGKTLLYLIGGANRAAEAFNDVHVFDYDKKRWTQASPQDNSAFEPRSGHTSIAIGACIYVFGGANLREGKVYNDLHILNTDTMEWTSPCADGDIPPPRSSHIAVALPQGMLIFGGSSPLVGGMNDTFLLTSKDGHFTWKSIASPEAATLAKRELHSACVLNNLVYICGGRLESGELCDELSILDTETWTWTIESMPAWRRCAHVSGVVHNQWLHFGGWDGGAEFCDDCWQLALDVRSSCCKAPMRQVELNGQGNGRFAHCGCVVDDKLVIFGGMTVQDDLNDTLILH